MADRPRAIVVGFDGGTWTLLQPWIDAGRLPTFARLQRAGAWGRLASTHPPVTFPAWRAYSTGKNPGKLGVYWWVRTDFAARRMVPNSGASFASRDYWDLLGEAGYRVGVVGMPGTFPPRRVNGFLAAGAPVVEGEPWTYPASLARELRERYGYEANPPGDLATDPREKVDGAIAQMRAQCAFARDRAGDVDLLHLTLFAIDNLQHLYWDRPDLLLEAWSALDEELAAFEPGEHTLILMSDHGFTAQRAALFVNRWLEEEGYLVLKRATKGDALRRVGLTRDRVTRWAERLRVRRLVPERVRARVGASLVNSSGLAMGTSRAAKVDWDRTVAIADGEGPLTVRPGPDRERLAREIRAKILASPALHGYVADVLPKDEVWHGEHLDLAPDLLLVPEAGVEISGALASRELVRTETAWKGTHAPHGMLLVAGPGVAPGRLDASLLDLAPTILRLFGVPAPADFDGRAIALETRAEAARA